MHPKNLSISEFDYELPAEKIAIFPLPERDQSRLLIYQNGIISEDIYRNIAMHIPSDSMLVFNDTKVIKARIFFQKPTGASIEIFCLEPDENIGDYAIVLSQKNVVRWKCMIGGAGKWKEKYLEKEFSVEGRMVTLKAELVKKLTDAYVVELSWNPGDYSFAEIIDHAGETPLPPYIKRKAESADADRYQSIYSHYEGSVAAPTAGLHFTEHIFSTLKEKNIDTAFVTLHVGAGTFKPVKAATMADHEMHAEWIDVSTHVIRKLIAHLPNKVFGVGTTSVRTIESLYWMGLKVFLNPKLNSADLIVRQWEPYESPLLDARCDCLTALKSLLSYLEFNEMDHLMIQTQIIIAPGYSFRILNGMATNFHQPKSTLLLLISAMVGENWRRIYAYALRNNFRFLSYGDGCLLFADNF